MFFFGLIIGAAINALLMALVVMLAGKIVVKEAPPYGEAFKACFIAAIANGLVSYAFTLGMGEDAILIPTIAGIVVAYAAYTLSIHKIIGYTLGQSAGIATAIMFVLIFAIAFAIGMVIVMAGGNV